MTGKNGVRYTQEQKEAIIKRMMPPNNESVIQISKEVGISDVTLYKWRKEARASWGGNSRKWTNERQME